jgi:quinol monooxygenase YgiN
VFTVAPENQARLIDLLTRATESTVRHVPGFISATLHQSPDGAKVAMYAQWRSWESAYGRKYDGELFSDKSARILVV